MKLYRTVVQTGADSMAVRWDASEEDAEVTYEQFNVIAGTDPNTSEAVLPVMTTHEIPTTKSGMVAFLNDA